MTAPDWGHNSFAEQARMEKAIALEHRLRLDGIPSTAARTLPPTARRNVERAAGVRRSSDETWDLTFRLLEDAEASTYPKGTP